LLRLGPVKNPAGSAHMASMTKFPWAKPRSPFAGASKADLQMLRQLTVAVLEWDRAAREGRYYWCPYAPEILRKNGRNHQPHVREAVKEKAWDRLRTRPNWTDIFEAHQLEHMRQYDSRASEVRRLREQLAEHVASCRCAA
jgi:hypothetical protein